MSAGAVQRRARVRAPAKINLDLRVLGKRPDGYHELRTIFQTISLADTIDMAFTPARKTSIELADDLAIPDNLAIRAARLALEAMRKTGRVEMRLTKRIPMGAGLGGGSSDAAAVLLALPVLAGGRLSLPKLRALAEELGSDVPFFLLGGTAVGIGRGTELFPLPDRPRGAGLLVTPGLHVNTAGAYRALSPRLTSESQQNKIVSFQTQSWGLGDAAAANDFEDVVFEQHRTLGVLKKKLLRAGASTAMMTGSGSALFGLFPTLAGALHARKMLGEEKSFRFSPMSRVRYRRMWWRALEQHTNGRTWPPQSRYAR
ncbi:MAG TPA: 4-(cytidine 5'-diphospho)-2-C-methyl-D-erythritol kinase [Candidatus Sulfopaludibacter sp.]|nr:4-(cytidine 5'-diphospho)-2-C-methyl-D-erythritol kinase [Candidatus Sulfopaludibacter sp.]